MRDFPSVLLQCSFYRIMPDIFCHDKYLTSNCLTFLNRKKAVIPGKIKKLVPVKTGMNIF
jgi:hypothetical protein